MKKGLIALSAVAAMSTASFAANVSQNDMMQQIEMLKKQIQMLESKVNGNISDDRFTKLEKKVTKNSKKINDVKAHDAGDNLKWNVDFRSQVDNIQYKHVSGKKSKNSALMTNRLWLGAEFQADENSIFKGLLSYQKAFGDSANHQQANTNPGYANFDWVTNENANDNTLKVKEAYWLYMNDSFMGNSDIAWTASVGRRPSTDGLGINVRADQKRKSPLSHVVNVEFDGASLKFDLDKVTGIDGMWLKFCGGRGLTNAKPRFQFDGTDYSEDKSKNPNVDMLGFIFVPYDDGQYSIHTNYSHAWNLIGYKGQDIMPGSAFQTAYGNYQMNPTNANAAALQMAMPSFNDVGDMDFATVLFKVDGIGNEINDFLDDTSVFASFAMSKTNPNKNGMLGSTDSKTGHSIWLGANMPCPISDDARVGIEWNKGSKYWRSMTYGEDTFAGSKIATRGQAWEIYRTQQLTKALSFSLRYTLMKYDYTGSNSFFGAEGTPYSMDSMEAKMSDAVEEAQSITANIRYRY